MSIVPAGPLDDLPTNRCVEIGDGRAVVVRVGSEVYAYRNECLHQASPLAGGLVKDGVITCPLHFWRYEAETGAKCGEPDLKLEAYPARIESGNIMVDVPAPPQAGSWRNALLDHAKEWDRGDG